MIKLRVNGKDHTVDVDPNTPLIYVLRNDLGLNGAKFGCGLGQCGACTVLANGEAILSCITPVASVQGQEVITLEGLGTLEHPHPIQKAFIEEQAVQCGYCTNGMILNTKVLLEKTPNPTEPEIRQALDHVICRCGGHVDIIRAVKRAAREVRE